MNTLMDMKSPVGVWLGKELHQVSSILGEHLQCGLDEVNSLCEELAIYQGKMLRPSLLLLSWKLLHPTDPTPKSVRTAAGVVELIHLATLVHDDVLDDADLRRGKQTINSLKGNEAAVMLGDYLLSSAFLLCSSIGNPDLNVLLGEVTNTLCSGEIVQLSNRDNVCLRLDQYYQIIHDKTASLIAASCEMGALLGGGTEKQIQTVKRFGDLTGTAFQIKDDLLDLLEKREDIGKPSGRDLEKGKLTLPVILFLNEHPNHKDDVVAFIKNGDNCALKELLEPSGSVSRALDVVNQFVEDATIALDSVFTNDVSEQMCKLVSQLKL